MFPAINSSGTEFFFVAFVDRIPNMPPETWRMLIFLYKPRIFAKLKFDSKSLIYKNENFFQLFQVKNFFWILLLGLKKNNRKLLR